MRPETFNFADIWEAVAARVPDRPAVVCGELQRTFRQLDQRADRLAGWMSASGVGPHDFLGVAMRNSVEFVETTLAAYKLRAVPVNVNYRFRASELRHVIEDGPLIGLVHDPDVETTQVAPSLRWTLQRGGDYEQAVEATSAARALGPRSGDDRYVLYTGGTTGAPKGVVWRMEDAFFTCIGGGDPRGDRGPVSEPGELVDRIGEPLGFLPAAPLVHAAGMWTTLRWLFAGSKVVLLPEFDPKQIWSAIEREDVSVMNIVGDAMALPLLDTAPESTPLRTLNSGGAGLSTVTKTALLERFPALVIKDVYGSSETGVQASSIHQYGDTDRRFRLVDGAVLESTTLQPVGVGETGLVARVGRVPLRYHGDAEKSAATFPEIDGQRYALTGDLARVEADGTVVVLGRGSQCINTGGEKVFPEEVEETLREHPQVHDAAVVGVDDPRWGQAVVAVVAGDADHEQLQAYCRDRLAGYKVPKRILDVDRVQRTAAGKLDYVWAGDIARRLS